MEYYLENGIEDVTQRTFKLLAYIFGAIFFAIGIIFVLIHLSTEDGPFMIMGIVFTALSLFFLVFFYGIGSAGTSSRRKIHREILIYGSEVPLSVVNIQPNYSYQVNNRPQLIYQVMLSNEPRELRSHRVDLEEVLRKYPETKAYYYPTYPDHFIPVEIIAYHNSKQMFETRESKPLKF